MTASSDSTIGSINVVRVLTVSSGWHRRHHSPATAKVPLGWGSEYWDINATQYEGYLQLRDRHGSMRRRQPLGELSPASIDPSSTQRISLVGVA